MPESGRRRDLASRARRQPSCETGGVRAYGRERRRSPGLPRAAAGLHDPLAFAGGLRGHVEFLQATAGNTAVARLIAGTAVAPSPAEAAVQRQSRAAAPACRAVKAVAPPAALPRYGAWADISLVKRLPAPGGLAAIRSSPGSSPDEMAYTPWTHPDGHQPEVNVVPYQLRPGVWTTRLEFKPASRMRVPAFFPGPGVHPVPGGAGTTYYVIGPFMSDLLRRGEMEHVDDYNYAHLLVSQTISQILYRVATVPRPQASTSAAAVECGWNWFRRALPPQLRWDASQAPTGLQMMWLQRQNSLAGATITERDEAPNRWHSVAPRRLTAAQKKKYGIPVAKDAYEVESGKSQIGQHPPEAVVGPRWSQLPTFD